MAQEKDKLIKIDLNIILHFCLITVILYALFGFIEAKDYINQECLNVIDCDKYKASNIVIAFDIFKNAILLFMIARIPLINFKNGIFTKKYLKFIIIFMCFEISVSYLATLFFYTILK